MKRQMTLDGFSFVKTKQRCEIHIFEFYCVSLYACCSMGLKHNTELTSYPQAKQFQSATKD